MPTSVPTPVPAGYQRGRRYLPANDDLTGCVVDENHPPGLPVVEEAADEGVEDSPVRSPTARDGENGGPSGSAVLNEVSRGYGRE